MASSGVTGTPLMAVQSPWVKSSSTYSGWSGASSGATLSTNMPLLDSALGSNQGSSRMPLSKLMCSRLRSVE
ncbi:hypothetical protein D3C71_2026880 [compost metagenome]